MKKPQKHAGGRPTIMTPDIIGKLEAAAGYGCPVTEMCFHADICPDTYYEYLKKNPKFADRIAALREKPVFEARKCVTESAKKDPEIGIKYLERVRKKEFSTRQEVELSERDDYDNLTDEQLAKIASGKAKPGDFIK